jgi:hypothetical protein
MTAGPNIQPPSCFYAVLGVEAAATPSDLKKAYHRLSLKHHPDKVYDPEAKESANAAFQRIRRAYEVLSDVTQRREYDEWRRQVATKATSASGPGESRARPTASRAPASKVNPMWGAAAASVIPETPRPRPASIWGMPRATPPPHATGATSGEPKCWSNTTSTTNGGPIRDAQAPEDVDMDMEDEVPQMPSGKRDASSLPEELVSLSTSAPPPGTTHRRYLDLELRDFMRGSKHFLFKYRLGGNCNSAPRREGRRALLVQIDVSLQHDRRLYATLPRVNGQPHDDAGPMHVEFVMREHSGGWFRRLGAHLLMDAGTIPDAIQLPDGTWVTRPEFALGQQEIRLPGRGLPLHAGSTARGDLVFLRPAFT